MQNTMMIPQNIVCQNETPIKGKNSPASVQKASRPALPVCSSPFNFKRIETRMDAHLCPLGANDAMKDTVNGETSNTNIDSKCMFPIRLYTDNSLKTKSTTDNTNSNALVFHTIGSSDIIQTKTPVTQKKEELSRGSNDQNWTLGLILLSGVSALLIMNSCFGSGEAIIGTYKYILTTSTDNTQTAIQAFSYNFLDDAFDLQVTGFYTTAFFMNLLCFCLGLFMIIKSSLNRSKNESHVNRNDITIQVNDIETGENIVIPKSITNINNNNKDADSQFSLTEKMNLCLIIGYLTAAGIQFIASVVAVDGFFTNICYANSPFARDATFLDNAFGSSTNWKLADQIPEVHLEASCEVNYFSAPFFALWLSAFVSISLAVVVSVDVAGLSRRVFFS